MWTCPTCGESIDDAFDACWRCAKAEDPPAPPPPLAITPPTPAHVNTSLCRRCGYDVHLMADDASCPECGESVRASRRSVWLSDADPTWLRRVQRGQWLVAAAGTIFLVSCTGGCLIESFASLWFGGNLDLAELILTIGVIIAGVSLAIGAFLVSEPDPRSLGTAAGERPDRLNLARTLFRSFALASCVAAGASPALKGVVPDSVSDLLFSTFVYVAALSGCTWMRGLAERVPDPPLAERFQRLRRLIAWSWPVAILGSALSRRLPLAGCFALVAGIAFLISVVRMYTISVRLQRALSRCEATSSLNAAARAAQPPS